MGNRVNLVEAVVLVFTGVLVLGTSTASEPATWTTTANLVGTEVVLDEALPDVILDVDLSLSAATIQITDPITATLDLEVVLTWSPPASDPSLVAPEVVVGLAQSSFAPEGGARAAGTPGAEALTLTAVRGALTTCDVSAGCVDRMRVHFGAGQVPAGASLTATWTLTAHVEGRGRAAPPPGVAASLVEVTGG